jgi:hypothetical protein
MSDERANADKSPEAPDASEPEQRSRPTDLAAIIALTVSFCIISALGGSLLYWAWRIVSVYMAIGHCAVFVAFMAGVHLIGFHLWRRQFTEGRHDKGKSPSSPIALEYRRPIKTALLQQGIILILALLVLDGGLTFNMAVIAVMAYWLAFGILVFRRPSSPTKGDILLVRYGFLLLFFIVLVAGPFVWKALGGW